LTNVNASPQRLPYFYPGHDVTGLPLPANAAGSTGTRGSTGADTRHPLKELS